MLFSLSPIKTATVGFSKNQKPLLMPTVLYIFRMFRCFQTEFRFYWGGTKFTEDTPDIVKVAKNNTYPMYWLPPQHQATQIFLRLFLFFSCCWK